MFHWICPECGREIAPNERECPACDPHAGASGSIPWPETAENVLPALSPQPATGDPLRDVISAMEIAEEPSDPPVSGILLLSPCTPVNPPPPAASSEILRVSPRSRTPVMAAGLTHQSIATPQPSMQSARSVPWRRTRLNTTPLAPPPFPVAVAPGAPQAPESRMPHPAPALAALANYSPLAGKPMRAMEPRRNPVSTDCIPRVTLAGPMLVKRLISFRDRELEPQFPEGQAFKKPLLPRWAWMTLVTVTMLGAGFGSVFSLVPRRSAEPPASSVARASISVARTVTNPLSRAIEVTGFRILMDPARKSEIQYLVVNHSASRFSGVTMFVTLRSANARKGEPPLCRFAFASPDLGPYEAREMTSTIEKLNRPVNLPDWQDIHAEVEISE